MASPKLASTRPLYPLSVAPMAIRALEAGSLGWWLVFTNRLWSPRVNAEEEIQESLITFPLMLRFMQQRYYNLASGTRNIREEISGMRKLRIIIPLVMAIVAVAAIGFSVALAQENERGDSNANKALISQRCLKVRVVCSVSETGEPRRVCFAGTIKPWETIGLGGATPVHMCAHTPVHRCAHPLEPMVFEFF